MNIEDIITGNGKKAVLLYKDSDGKYRLFSEADSLIEIKKELNELFKKVENNKKQLNYDRR